MRNIIEGWSKKILIDFGFLTPPKYAIERMKVCNGCERNVQKICQECGCPLEAKTLAKNDNCDLGKWE